jgi:hypothetical protein
MDVPQLPDDLPWVGVPGRPALGPGRVVVHLFWSATSVHCERALAVLDWIDLVFAGRPLTIASVHVPRHPAERGRGFVESACARFAVRHPVLVDDEAAAAAAFAVRRLPTLVILDAEGALRFRGGGEPDRERLTAAIGALLGGVGSPPPPRVEAGWPRPGRLPPTALRFPTGLAVDAHRGLLWIADTGRHRVLACGLDDQVLRHQVGNGRPGATDGDLGQASFCAPRGLSAGGRGCYVADAGNHLIRRIDPDGFGVDTLLGQGRLVADRAGGLAGTSQGIASPWDVELVGDELFVAMAGVHQIWLLNLGDGYAQAWSGSGHPGQTDGMRHDASFAQPAALAFGCDELAIADSDEGTVRIAGLSTQHVHTLHGGTAGGEGLAQPRGLAWHRGDLLCADSLHGRVLRLRARDGAVEVLAEGLRGPEGLAVHGDRLFVAETLAHRILSLDLEGGAPVPLALVDPHPEFEDCAPPPQKLRPAATVRFCFPMPCPPDESLHADVEARAFVRPVEGAPIARACQQGPVELQGSWGTLAGIETGAPGSGEVEVLVRYATCQDRAAEPHIQELCGRFRLDLEEGGPEVAELVFGP